MDLENTQPNQVPEQPISLHNNQTVPQGQAPMGYAPASDQQLLASAQVTSDFSEQSTMPENPVINTTTQPLASDSPQPLPLQPIVASGPVAPNKINKKIIILVAATIGLIGIGITLWFLFFNGISLTKYDNTADGYSLMVPASYIKDEGISSASFRKPDKNSNILDDKRSLVQVAFSKNSIGKEALTTQLDTIFNEKSFESGGMLVTSQTISDVKIEKSTKNGMAVRIAYGKIVAGDNMPSGVFRLATVVSETKVVTIAVQAFSTDQDLINASAKIIDSLEIK
ncbi:MAG: hypothetical protein WCP11_02885 [Candidatus Saccharibacteria bacterium]